MYLATYVTNFCLFKRCSRSFCLNDVFGLIVFRNHLILLSIRQEYTSHRLCPPGRPIFFKPSSK